MLEKIHERIPVDPEHSKQMGLRRNPTLPLMMWSWWWSRQPTRALAFGSNSRGFSWPWWKGQSCTRQNSRQRLCTTNHKVVSIGDIKRTERTEHSPVQRGGCPGERSNRLFQQVSCLSAVAQFGLKTVCLDAVFCFDFCNSCRISYRRNNNY